MAGLTPDQVSQFEDQGYLVVCGLFDPGRDFAAVFRDSEAVLEGFLQNLLAAGEIPSTWPDLDFAQRSLPPATVGRPMRRSARHVPDKRAPTTMAIGTVLQADLR